MKSHLGMTLAAVGCLLAFCTRPALAQPQLPRPGVGFGQPSAPAYSPYLNLLRNNNPLYSNYYGIVQPELQWRGAVQNLQQQVTTNDQAIGSALDPNRFPMTGHSTRFLSTGGYFLNSAGARGAGGAGGRGGNVGGQAAGGRVPSMPSMPTPGH